MIYFPITLSVVLGSSLIVALFFNSCLSPFYGDQRKTDLSQGTAQADPNHGRTGSDLIFNKGVYRGFALMIAITLLFWAYKYFLKRLASVFKISFCQKWKKDIVLFCQWHSRDIVPLHFDRHIRTACPLLC